ncbi:MAG: glycosyltransferase [Planctomycetota bacterium]
MAQERPGISIIIRTRNEERFIARTLEAVMAQVVSVPFEVIVLDSGSQDRTLELVRRFDVPELNLRLETIDPERFTFGLALNLGARLAQGDIIVNLSAHCLPVDSAWLARLVEPLRVDPAVAASHGKQVPMKGVNPYEERLLVEAFSPDRHGKVSVVFSNSNGAVRKRVLEEFPFDEKAAFGEDFIWARRLPARLQVVYVPEAAVYHSHPLSLRYWARRYYQIGLQERYMEQVYGLHFPLQNSTGCGQPSGGPALLREMRAVLSFLLEAHYYRHLLLFPLYFAVRRSAYHKGLREGLKRYGGGAPGASAEGPPGDAAHEGTVAKRDAGA